MNILNIKKKQARKFNLFYVFLFFFAFFLISPLGLKPIYWDWELREYNPEPPRSKKKNAKKSSFSVFRSRPRGVGVVTRLLAPRSLPGASGWHHRSTMKWQKAPRDHMNPPGLPQEPGPPPKIIALAPLALALWRFGAGPFGAGPWRWPLAAGPVALVPGAGPLALAPGAGPLALAPCADY